MSREMTARQASSILSATSASSRSGRIFTSSGSPSRARVLRGPTLMRPFSASRIFQMRSHRLHPAKRDVQIYDFVDRDVPVLMRMFEKRLRGYRAIGYARGEAPLGYADPSYEHFTRYDDEIAGELVAHEAIAWRWASSLEPGVLSRNEIGYQALQLGTRNHFIFVAGARVYLWRSLNASWSPESARGGTRHPSEAGQSAEASELAADSTPLGRPGSAQLHVLVPWLQAPSAPDGQSASM